MPGVAVAGGTGNLGRAIVVGLLKADIQVVVFTRKSESETEKEIGARIIAIDYEDETSIVAALEENKIETLISALGVQSGYEPESVLIKAAEKSSVTKRYIPSVWSLHYTPETAAIFPPGQDKIRMIKQLETSSLEWTAIATDFFIDHYLSSKVPSTMPPMAVFLDIGANTASIPGTGNTPVVFTYSADVAKYVAALIKLDQWKEHEYTVIGDKVTLNEFVSIAEHAKNIKFTISHDSLEELRQGRITELLSHSTMYPFFPKHALQSTFAAFGILFDSGALDLRPSSSESLNELFPKIAPRSVKELIEEAWGM